MTKRMRGAIDAAAYGIEVCFNIFQRTIGRLPTWAALTLILGCGAVACTVEKIKQQQTKQEVASMSVQPSTDDPGPSSGRCAIPNDTSTPRWFGNCSDADSVAMARGIKKCCAPAPDKKTKPTIGVRDSLHDNTDDSGFCMIANDPVRPRWVGVDCGKKDSVLRARKAKK